MPKQMTVFASAILAVLVPAMVSSVRSSHAQGAADNCLAKPNAATPQGSHWYYRVDRAGNRRCWYLGPEGAQLRQAWSPKPQPAPNLRPKPAAQAKETASSATPAQPVTRDTDPAATFSMLSAALPTLASAVDGEPAIASNDAAGEPVAMHPGDDMPVIWPVLTAADHAAAEQPPGMTVNLEAMLAYVAAALALVMIVYKVFRLFAARRLRRRRMALREQWNQTLPVTPLREPVVFADTVAAACPTQPGRKLVAVPPTAKIALAPADDRDPDHDIDVESLRQLLHGLRRVAA